MLHYAGPESPTAEETVYVLIEEVEEFAPDGVLKKGKANSLANKLEESQDRLAAGLPHVAINKLSDFIDQVNAHMNAGVLSLEEGSELIGLAEQAIALIENP